MITAGPAFYCPIYRTHFLIRWNHQSTGGTDMSYSVSYVCCHLEVYAEDGTFLFSADNSREVRETLKELSD